MPRLSAGLSDTDEVNGAATATAEGAIRIAGIESVPETWVQEVIVLGDKNRNRLGPMPYAGFREAAAKGNIVLAIRTHDDGTEALAGYCLYAPTVRADRYARIAHLCVAQGERGQGIPARLVDAVMERCSDRLGLRLKCRDDWEAAAKWPSLGFEPVRRRTGRGKTNKPMTEWVRHNDDATTLLSLPSADPEHLLVAVDCNVFCDLFGTSPKRKHRFSGTVAVLAASEQIRLARPFSLTGELNRTTDLRERDALLHTAAASGLKLLKGDSAAVEELRDELFAGVPNNILATDDSLETDATLLAEAILGGADVFVTRDQNAVTYLGPTAAKGRDFTVLYPDELPAFIDRRADAAGYLPTQLHQTGYQVTRGDAATWNPERRMELLEKESGETKPEFRARIRASAERSVGTDDRQVMFTPDGDVLAIWAAHDIGTVLDVPLLRIQRGPLLPTIARQLSRAMRRRAADNGLTTVRLADTQAHVTIRAELQRDGFSPGPNGLLTATVLTTVGTWEQVKAAAHAVPETGVALPAHLGSTAEASEYERVLWPAKVLHPDLPTFFIPIRGVFADDLLGHMPTLLARPDSLGLSREHVYYKSGNTRPPSPGRILWYSSRRDKEVVACSRLVESVTGTPEVLHREFSNIGVLTLDQVRGVKNKQGKVTALRFADTEILKRPLPLARVQSLSVGTVNLTIQSPVPVDPATFKQLYEEGMRS
ncbi:GNAT family N-acetyltransferase [Nocardioides alkalitolerans]|uniref:GNAT family N-acetyltransferase n=1 Tax=Nocardioides alkalitolerans TaxID=281714 RepID=UPI000490A24E|nr:GNAT family N-acetyltransferase [Nocardioides alkalitolerans]